MDSEMVLEAFLVFPCGRMTQKYQKCTEGCDGMSWHINSNEGSCECSPKN